MREASSTQTGIGESYSRLVDKGLIDAAGPYPGDNRARDAVALALLLPKCEEWSEILPVVSPLPRGWKYSSFTPREFFDLFLGDKKKGGKDGRGGGRCRTVPVVDGDLFADIHEIWNRRKWTGLSRLVVRGEFSLAHCSTIQSLDITCLGTLAIEDCLSLKTLRGEVFGDTVITNSGVGDLGADFRCRGEVFLEGCQELRRINCEVGGNFTVESCGLRSTGPAFSVGGKANFSSCPALERLAGVIAGKGRIEPGLRNDVDCSHLLVHGN
jgi:hypothetical protein